MAYLVRQCQQEVIEENDSDRDWIMLASILHQHSQPEKRWKLKHTLIAALKISGSGGSEDSVMNGMKERGRT
jgi:hypothetical protein